MDLRDFRGEGWRLGEWERGLKLHEPHTERILVGYRQLIRLGVFEEASCKVENLQMTCFNTASSHQCLSDHFTLF